MASWPAVIGPVAEEGTCYVRPHQFAEAFRRHGPRGHAWRFHDAWTTYCPSRRLTYKNYERLGATSVEDFWTIMTQARLAGLAPPTSLGGLFTETRFLPFPRPSVIAPFLDASFGGWQEAFRRGDYHGHVYHYDLRKAYRWAACAGLPDLRTAYLTRAWDAPRAIYLVQVPAGAIPYRRAPGVAIVTSEERDALRLQDARCRVLYGVAFCEELDLGEHFAAIDTRFPSLAARISRSFWGLWNTRAAPLHVTFAHGERSRQMRNPFYNPIWSAWVTSRVKLRLATFRRVALHAYVDALLTTERLPEGEDVGAWKLVDEYPAGVWVRAPGVWGSGTRIIKHVGRPALEDGDAEGVPAWVTEAWEPIAEDGGR